MLEDIKKLSASELAALIQKNKEFQAALKLAEENKIKVKIVSSYIEYLIAESKTR